MAQEPMEQSKHEPPEANAGYDDPDEVRALRTCVLDTQLRALCFPRRRARLVRRPPWLCRTR